MRVIAGEAKGRKLASPRTRAVRPTSDRVREAIFDVLSYLDAIEDRAVVDLYAGTGALGIEALSRGASWAVFVERDPAVARVLRENLTALGIGEQQAQLRRTDAVQALRSARERKETYDLLFIDPPYRQAHELGPELSALLPALLAPRARIVVESDRRAPLELALGLALERERRYGDTTITIHRHQ